MADNGFPCDFFYNAQMAMATPELSLVVQTVQREFDAETNTTTGVGGTVTVTDLGAWD
ncbi:MAG: hypothetical protein ACNYPE_08435 [Candidatus Azotimanducaceae bacterium WSBS_2022_MAG_OTU7]